MILYYLVLTQTIVTVLIWRISDQWTAFGGLDLFLRYRGEAIYVWRFLLGPKPSRSLAASITIKREFPFQPAMVNIFYMDPYEL
jgi:hypothetical protein